jgi:hypothetical protein
MRQKACAPDQAASNRETWAGAVMACRGADAAGVAYNIDLTPEADAPTS